MCPGVLTSTCSVMEADASTSTVAASYTASVLSDFKEHLRSSSRDPDPMGYGDDILIDESSFL